MKLEKVSTNVTKVFLPEWTVLFSYNTPVAALEISTGKYYRTSEFHSVTTSKHINQWLSGWRKAEAIEKPQEFFNQIVEG